MTELDMADTIVPKSDQLNADDLVAGPRTFTITEVRKRGSDEQPVSIVLGEFPKTRPYKPSKGMRRVMVEAWGRDGAKWVGKRFTLYRDQEVLWAGQPVGGIRISHMSDLPGGRPLRMALTVAQSKREQYVVQPLPDAAPSSVPMSAATLDELVATLRRKGIPEDQWLSGVNYIIGGSATALEVITEDDAQKVLGSLAGRPDVVTDPGAPTPTPAADDSYDPTAEPGWEPKP